MQSKAKTNSVVTATYDPATATITYTVLDIGTIPFRLGMVAQANRNRAEVHGWGQRVPDKAAISADPAPKDATPEERAALDKARRQRKFDLMSALVAHYETGSEEWSPARDAAGPGLDSVILAAVGEVLGKDADAVRAIVAAGAEKNKVTQRAYLARLGTGKAVQPIVDRMRAAQASDIDPDAELAELMAAAEEEDTPPTE